MNPPRGAAAPLVLHVTAPGVFGGRETAVAALAESLYALHHPVEVLAVLDAGSEASAHPFVERLRDAGVPVRAPMLRPRAYADEARTLREAVRETGAAVVHSHGYRTDVVAALALGKSGVALVSTAHGFTGGGWKNRLYELLQSVAWRRFAAVVAVSDPLSRSLVARGIPEHRVRTIRNAWRPPQEPIRAVEARRRLGIGDAEVALGWVGRLSPEKGPDVALAALAALRNARVRLHVLGAGRLQGELENLARRLDLADRVRWHGAIPEAGALISAFDLFLLSSRSEGTPMVLFEAMASGTPIIATAVGGVPDVLTEREARLVPPDDPEVFARAIREALADRTETEVRARCAGERLLAEFAVEPWAHAHLALYREVLAGDGRS